MKYFSVVIFFLLIKNLRAQGEDVLELLAQKQLAKNVSVNFEDHRGELCFRTCKSRDRKICYFKWTLENYHTVGPACKACLQGNRNDCYAVDCLLADGFEKGVMSINRKIPGPSIHVCRDDIIVVDVMNAASGSAASIHWHGFHQRDTPYMDGVPFVTQCPIDFGTKFRYIFQATQKGTQFYHSHAGHHKINGQYGGIVVRDLLSREFNRDFYDLDLPEHLIILSDWMDTYGENFMPGLQNHVSKFIPTNILINGRGARIDRKTRRNTTSVPLEVFRLTTNKKYRFRLVNSASLFCPLQIEIEDHQLNMIATDSFDFKPVLTEVLISSPGERYDFVPILKITKNRKANYWVRISALGSCQPFNIEQFAILSYEPLSVKSIDLAFPTEPFPSFNGFAEGKSTFNNPQTKCEDFTDTHHCVSDVSAYVERPDIMNAVPDHKLFLSFNLFTEHPDHVFGSNQYNSFMAVRDGLILIAGINRIAFKYPHFSILTQPEKIDESTFCDKDNMPNHCNPKHQVCFCVHRLKVKLNSIVEMIIVDEAPNINRINHPFHLHGHQFYVMGISQNNSASAAPMTVELAQAIEKQNGLPRFAPNKAPPAKDTVLIPTRGYSIIRFKADNPGFWLLHCHFEWHLAVGMGLILQVGELDEMVKPPKNFNKCNNYTPKLNADILESNKKIEL